VAADLTYDASTVAFTIGASGKPDVVGAYIEVVEYDGYFFVEVLICWGCER